MNGRITWYEHHDVGYARLTWDNDDYEQVRLDQPIHADSNSTDIANLFDDFDTVDHDGATIHVHNGN